MNNEASAASAKRKIRKTEIVGDEMIWTYANDEQLVCDWRALSDDIRKSLMLHGLKQKVGDAAAGADTIREAQMAMAQVVNNLTAGVWGTRSQGSSILAEAMAKVTGCTVEEAMEALSKVDEEKVKEIRKRPDIKLAETQIKAERLKAKVTEDAPSLDEII